MKKWYKLDNIGTFYSLTSNSSIAKVFRYSVFLNEEIDPKTLQLSLNKTLETFPNFNVNLKKGFYWYYLSESTKQNKVTKENLPVCFKIYKNEHDLLYRVSYYKNKINLEISHILSDGKGTIEFLKLLITNYISLKYNIENNYINKSSEQNKTENSFKKYNKKEKQTKKEKIKIYKYKGKHKINRPIFMESHLPLDKIIKLSKQYNTTITILLLSILIYSFKDTMNTRDLNKYIKIDIPVDLRNFFNSKTTMNFFGLTNVTYKLNTNDSLIEIINEITKQFKQKLSERVNKMVSFEKNIFCRIVPLFIKRIVLNIIDKFTSNMSTTCLSNLGLITLDKDIEKYIKYITVNTNPTNFQFTICSFKNDLSIGVSSIYTNNDIIKNFFRYFTSNNIDVKIDVSEV